MNTRYDWEQMVHFAHATEIIIRLRCPIAYDPTIKPVEGDIWIDPENNIWTYTGKYGWRIMMQRD